MPNYYGLERSKVLKVHNKTSYDIIKLAFPKNPSLKQNTESPTKRQLFPTFPNLESFFCHHPIKHFPTTQNHNALSGFICPHYVLVTLQLSIHPPFPIQAGKPYPQT